MLKTLGKHIVEGTTFLGLEIYELDGKETFSLLKLTKHKGELDVVFEETSESLKNLAQQIEKKHPLFVTFNTNQVLKKQVPTETKNNPELSVINAFPNLELDNFYYQLLQGEQNTVVSISKKEHIEWYVEQLSKIGIHPVSVGLGIAPLEIFQGLLDDTVQGSNYHSSFDQTGFQDYQLMNQPTNTSIDLNGIQLGNNQLLSFGSILGFLQKSNPVSNLYAINQHLWYEFKNHKIFDFGVKASLIFFLALLLGNFFAFNHYHSKNQELESSLATNQFQDQSIKDLQERVDLKEQKLKSLQRTKNSKTTYVLDELGKSIPNSIYLNDIQYQPLLMPIRKDKSIELGKQNLQVSGIANNKLEFTVWSDNLESQKWVNRVEIMDYEYLSKSSANFTLNLVLHEVE